MAVDAALTVRLSVWVLVTPPPVAVTVSEAVPTVAVEVADNFKVLLPEPGEAMLAGAKVAVTPFGRPLTEKATAEWKPFCAVVERVMDAALPAVTLALVALGDRVKVGGGLTVRLIVWVFVTPPPVAVTVS